MQRPLFSMRCCTVFVTLAFFCVGCSSTSDNSNEEVSSAESLPAPQYPTVETWEAATERQAARAARSLAELKKRKVPVYEGPLMVDDDDSVRLQDAQEVARRVLILWAVELRAEGVSQEEVVGIIDKLDLWDSVSPEEKRFLAEDSPDPQEARRLVWRLESMWVLMWALGYIDELGWPSEMCDVESLVAIVEPNEANPDFINGAKLRSKAEILDAQDLTMRIHWAIRDAYLRDEPAPIPIDLDWSGDSQRVPVAETAGLGVVEERHYVLNWLVNFLDPKSWDDVETPT